MIQFNNQQMLQRPEGWDETSDDGVYGDVDALEASCNAGEEQIVYLLRHNAVMGGDASHHIYQSPGWADGPTTVRGLATRRGDLR